MCNFATKLKYYAKVDDAMDILAEHGVAGVIGLIFNALLEQTGSLVWMALQSTRAAG